MDAIPTPVLVFAGLFLGAVILLVWAAVYSKKQKAVIRDKRARFISGYRFPAELSRRLRQKHPELPMEKTPLVLEGLRQFFLAVLGAQTNAIAGQCGMPSRAVDDAWHEFILMTRDYSDFCKGAFGKYLHHTPEAQMTEKASDSVANTLHQLRGAPIGAESWAMAGAVPLLFALDGMLHVRDGYHHDADSLEALDKQRWLLAQQQQATGTAGHAGSESGGSYGHGPGSDSGSSSCGDGGGSGGGCSGGGGGCGGSG